MVKKEKKKAPDTNMYGRCFFILMGFTCEKRYYNILTEMCVGWLQAGGKLTFGIFE